MSDRSADVPNDLPIDAVLPQVVAAVLGRLDASATAVFAVDDECAPVTDRIVVSVRVSAAALERSSS